MKLNEQPFTLDTTIEYCVSTINELLSGRNMELADSLGPIENKNVIGDEYHLQQILLSVLENAIENSPEDCSIRFKAEEILNDETRSTYVFVVQHTYSKKKQHLLSSLAGLFKKKEKKPSYPASYGLSIVKTLVDLLHGKFTITHQMSERTMTISIPLVLNQWLETPLKKRAKTIKGAMILLAEDTDINAELMKEFLMDQGAKVEVARNGKIALDMYSSSTPFYYDIILMDVMMPFMDGLEATRLIRTSAREDANFIPIIAITVKSYSEDIQAAFDAGMNSYFVKPIDRKEMMRVISDHLATSTDYSETMKQRAAAAGPSGKILIVDDDDFTLDSIRNILSYRGYKTDVAKDGSIAVNMISSSTPGEYGMILMDVRMPNMDGFEATRIIRSLEDTSLSEIPIVAMTADSQPSDRDMAISVGMNDYIVKPLTTERLMVILQLFAKAK